ncbi:MAG: Tfp pilus assembly protein FimT/FimU [Chthoniobacteraceae bacterium]
MKGNHQMPLVHGTRKAAFSLVELLAVMAVILVMTSVVVPVLRGVTDARDITRAGYNIQGILDRARAHAMSSNTYVYVGIAEVDASVGPTAASQVTTGNTPYGRVAVAVVATKDGTRGYDVNNPGNWFANYDGGTSSIVANLKVINKLQQFENLHLVDLGTMPPSSGPMARPAAGNGADINYNVANAGFVSLTPFTWPVGASLSTGYQYYFQKVICFDPQGTARVQSSSNADAIPKYMEIGLQPSHGNTVPGVPANQNIGDQMAIQIDGMTGATRIYRP